MLEFTLEELAKYNGQNGQPAYIAVNQLVYDLSSVFINGRHCSLTAGQDVTVAFEQQHVMSMLKNYPVVGRLIL